MKKTNKEVMTHFVI